MTTEKIKNAYNKYGLTRDDVYKHQHYIIITRSGIEKIQAIENIKLDYEIVKCEKDFCVMKAIAIKGKEIIQTFGSALKGEGFKDGNTMSWYVVEMAEKSYVKSGIKNNWSIRVRSIWRRRKRRI